jgi:hypothetical protein
VAKIARYAGASHGGHGAGQEAAAQLPDAGTLPAQGEDLSEDEAAAGAVQEPEPDGPEPAAGESPEPAPAPAPKAAPTLSKPKAAA